MPFVEIERVVEVDASARDAVEGWINRTAEYARLQGMAEFVRPWVQTRKDAFHEGKPQACAAPGCDEAATRYIDSAFVDGGWLAARAEEVSRERGVLTETDGESLEHHARVLYADYVYFCERYTAEAGLADDASAATAAALFSACGLAHV